MAAQFSQGRFKPGVGAEIFLPRDARDGIALIRAHKLKYFWLGKGLFKKTLILQRTAEGAFPALPKPGSPDIIDFVATVDLSACVIVDRRGLMAYARCRR